jgi:TRAP-type mannitol/chloroaromatic compound transport system permease small subunit
MRGLLRACDRLSTAVGQLFGWLIVGLTLLIAFEVVSRYAFDRPTAWSLDLSIMGFAALFMMAGAYGLAQQAHVRGDILYGMLSPRSQAGIDLVLYLGFFCPGVTALVWAGFNFAAESWSIREQSALTAGGAPVYPLKASIPLAGGLLMLQGLAEALRCVICLRSGAWPERQSDVAEIDLGQVRAGLGAPLVPERRP